MTFESLIKNNGFNIIFREKNCQENNEILPACAIRKADENAIPGIILSDLKTAFTHHQ